MTWAELVDLVKMKFNLLKIAYMEAMYRITWLVCDLSHNYGIITGL